MEGGLLPAVAVVVGLGLVAQVVAGRVQVPSVLFLLVAGVVVGPAGLGLLRPTTLGTEALSTVVGVAVALIVFEAGFGLDREEIRLARTAIFRLTTVGALFTFLATTAVVALVLDVQWGVAALVGALLVATGPTVIGPILAVVHVPERVAAAMETEGLVDDVTAAVAAVAVFEALVVSGDPSVLVGAFLARLAAGLLVGGAVAGALWYLFHRVEHSPYNAPRDARLLVLAGAVVAYGGAEALLAESGIVAAASAGVLLGVADLPYEEHVAAFKDEVTVLALSVTFVLLAALVDVDALLALGWRGVAVVLALALVVRPAAVLLSTAGLGFTWNERAFVSLVAPRGIVPASVATLFALRLRQTDPAAATVLVGTVFLVIVATVAVEGGGARHLAAALGVTRQRVVVVGGGRLGLALAGRYTDQGERVELVENDPDTIEAGRREGFAVHAGDGTDPDVLAAAGAGDARRIVAVADDDEVNLRVAELARERFGDVPVVARVNDPLNDDRFEERGVRTLAGAQVGLWAIDRHVGHQTPDWLVAFMRDGEIQTVTVRAPSLAGETVGALERDLPRQCIVGALARDGDVRLPPPDERVALGDHLTFLGRREAVETAVGRCRPPDAE
ncbi:MAG: cation:proton antiporter [Haloarculaceae archaeon]